MVEEERELLVVLAVLAPVCCMKLCVYPSYVGGVRHAVVTADWQDKNRSYTRIFWSYMAGLGALLRVHGPS